MDSILIKFNNICIQSSDIISIKRHRHNCTIIYVKSCEFEYVDIPYEQATDAYFDAVYKLLKQENK